MMCFVSHENVTLRWKSNSFSERDAPGTSGGTTQLRGEHIEKSLQDLLLRIPDPWTV